VVLEVQAHAGQVNKRLHASLAELLRVTNTTSLQDQRRAKSTTRHNNLLSSSVDLAMFLVGVKGLGRYGLDTDCLATLEDDLFDFGVDSQVQILVNSTSAVDISMSRVTSTSRVTVDPLQPVFSTVTGDQVLEIVCGRNALGLRSAQEVFLDWVCVVAE
jgi:hypothetical protein